MKSKNLIVAALVCAAIAFFFALATGKFITEETPAEKAARSAEVAGREADRKQKEAEALRSKINNAEGPAYRAARNHMLAQLKSPASADFASILNSEVVNRGEGRYKVTSYVDSQNDFGALIRTRFMAQVETDDGVNFRVVGFSQ